MHHGRANELEQGRISQWQAMVMVIILGLATTDILVPTIIADLSGRDAWLAVFVATAAAMGIIAVVYTLAARLGDRTVLQYARDSLGRWPGGFVALFIILFILDQAALDLFHLRVIMLTAFYQDTPDIVFKILIAALAIYMVYGGLEVVARFNELLLPAGVVILLFVGFMAADDLKLKEFLPVLENGFSPVLAGSLRLAVYLAQGSLVYLLLFPYIKKSGRGLTNALLAVASLGPIMLVGVMAIGVFGLVETTRMRLVALELVRNIEVAGFVQNLDALIMVIWYGGIVAKLCILFYLASFSMAQWLGLTGHRPLLLPLAAVLVAYSMLMFADVNEAVDFITWVQPGWDLTALLFLPLGLLLLTFITKTGKGVS